MIKFKNESLNEPATENQMSYLNDLLNQEKASRASRQPSAKGQALLAAMVLPERTISKWEASSLISIFDSRNFEAYFKLEHDRRAAGEKITSTAIGAALRSVFPSAYAVLYGDK